MTNYDSTTLPAGYDRARDHGPENLALWMRAVAARVDGRAESLPLSSGEIDLVFMLAFRAPAAAGEH